MRVTRPLPTRQQHNTTTTLPTTTLPTTQPLFATTVPTSTSTTRVTRPLLTTSTTTQMDWPPFASFTISSFRPLLTVIWPTVKKGYASATTTTTATVTTTTTPPPTTTTLPTTTTPPPTTTTLPTTTTQTITTTQTSKCLFQPFDLSSLVDDKMSYMGYIETASFKTEIQSVIVITLFCLVSVLCLTIFTYYKLNQIVRNQTNTVIESSPIQDPTEFEDVDLNSDKGSKKETKRSLFERIRALANRVRKIRTKSYSFKDNKPDPDSNIRLQNKRPIADEWIEMRPFMSSNSATIEVEIHEHKMNKKKNKKNVLPRDPDAFQGM
jgi:hypothetical protein